MTTAVDYINHNTMTTVVDRFVDRSVYNRDHDYKSCIVAP